MLKRILSIGGVVASMVLMALPSGVAMTFAPGPNERITNYYSYFDFMPLGYGNWFPVLTIIMSFAALILLLIGIKTPKVENAARTLLGLCLMASVFSWLFFGTFSVVGVGVFVAHGIAFLLSLQYRSAY